MGCKGCQDRKAEPNCHDYCEEFLAKKKERSELNKKMFIEKGISNTVQGLHVNRCKIHKKKKG